MQGLKNLRLGRGLIKRAKRARIRRSQPRFSLNKLRSQFRAAPVKPRPSQPYLGSKVKLGELL